ncbi:MAG TPA: hypothetical protein PLT51_02555 [Candidatus Dojkabacteria bacterium]|nr:hypothetical protein [Candidatus Dojkabacteria bacterium]
MNNNIQNQTVGNISNNSIPNQQVAPSAESQVQGPPTLAEPIAAQIKEETEGVNLIPSRTKEEEIQVKKKTTLSIGSLLAIIILALVSIGIVGFNIITKNQLSDKKKELANMENIVNQKADKIIANNVILDRINLYKKVKANSFSHKKVITFLREMAGKIQGITYDSMEISEDLSFKISGDAPNLEQLSRMWYLFGVNENIETIKLKSFSKTETGATFSFDGKLVLDNFKAD